MNKYFTFCMLILWSSNIFCQTSDKIKDRIAVLDFQILANEDDFQQYKWMSLGFSESLTDVFARVSTFSVVERSQLDRILKEQQLQELKEFDTSTVVKVGKLLGVNKVIIGSCQIVTGYMLVNMRIVDVQTGLISPIQNLPRITPIDSVLYLEKRICVELLNQFNIFETVQDRKEIETVTTKSTKSIKAYEYLNKGIAFYNNEQYQEAIDMYNIALSCDNKYGKAFYRRGLTNYALSLYENAAEDFNNSKKYLKQDTIYQLMSDAYFNQGLYKQSYYYLKKAEKLNPTSATIKTALLRYEGVKLVDNANLDNSSPDSLLYETIFEFNGGRAKVAKNHKYGFIDTLNNVIIPIVYDQILNYSYGYAAVKVGSKWGFIDYKGNVVIEPQYTEVGNFTRFGIAWVMLKYNWGLINTTGKQIVPIEYNRNYSWSDADSLIIVCKYKNSLTVSQICGVYDILGAEILPLIYEDISFVRENYYYDNDNKLIKEYYPYFFASLDDKWGVVDRHNEIIIPFKYDSEDCIRPFYNGLAAVKVNERWGFVNHKGLEIINPQYDRVKDFRSNYLEVKLRGKWGLVDTNNVEIFPIIYDNIEYISNGYWAVKKNNLWGIIDINKNLICDFSYEAIGSEIKDHTSVALYGDNNKFVFEVKKDGKIFWINEKCRCVYDCK